MPRSKRTVIDNAEEFGFSNYGTNWDDRGVEQTYTAEPIAPQDDWTTLSVPAIDLGDGLAVATVTLWGRGLVTFGAPTQAQIAYMATLTADTDLGAFLDGFPTDYIDVGFQHDAYGDVEFGLGERDFVANPFGVFHDPGDPNPTGPAAFDRSQARAFAYATWADEPLEGTAEDWDGIENVPIGPGGLSSIRFSDEGFQLGGGGGVLHHAGHDTALGGGFVYYSDLNPVSLTSAADVASVSGGPERLMGLGGDDRLTGGAYADRLDGGDGADVLVGGGGIDRLFGGDGDDDLSDGDEQGSLYGGAGDDILRPGGGEDTIDGGDGTDRVVLDYASWDGDIAFTLDPTRSNYLLSGDLFKSITHVEAVTFTAGGGDDYLAGAGDDDVIAGGGGQDALLGGDGADVLSGGANRDYLEGGAGDDWLSGGTGEGPLVSQINSYLTVSLDSEPFQLLQIGQSANGAVGDTPTYGWSGQLAFTVDDPASQYLSLSSSEIVSDTSDVSGGYYWSLYRVEASGELTYVDAFSTTQFADDVWVDQPGRYLLTVDTYDDDPAPLSVQVLLHGRPIPDGDTMVGGTGDDTYIVDSLYDRVLENSGEGRDTIVTSLATYSLASLPEIERLVGDASAQTLTGNGADNAIQSGGGADTLDGAGGDDRLTIGGTPAHVEGGAGVDTLVIAADASVTLAPALVSGIEKILVQSGATLDVSAFADVLAPLRAAGGGAGVTIIGTGGADRIFGGDGADTLAGGAGQDRMAGGRGDDLYRVDDAGDTPNEAAGEGFDTVEATLDWRLGKNLEALVLGDGAAIAGKGNELDNVLTGNANANVLKGLAGDDVLIGGAGRDVLTGGEGQDVFRFDATIARTLAEADWVTDFATAQDQLDLSGVGRFTFVGAAAFTGQAGELRYDFAGKTTIVSGDLDGDGVGDVFIQLKGRVPLEAGDLILANPAALVFDAGGGEVVHGWLAAHAGASTAYSHLMLA